MANHTQLSNNYATMRVSGSFTLSAAGAVASYKGDGITVAKNGTGLYEVTYSNQEKFVINENLDAGAALIDAAVGTVKDVGVKSQFANVSGGDTMKMIVRTVDAAGADVDEATNGLTVSFYGVFRFARMTHPFA